MTLKPGGSCSTSCHADSTIPIFLAGPRSATAALVQICLCDINVAIDLSGCTRRAHATF
jgi:hypothetical protein